MMSYRDTFLGTIAIACILALPSFLKAQAGSAAEHMLRARQLIGQGRTAAAIQEYEAAVAAEPANVEAQANLGVLQFFANDCVSALPHLTAAMAADPSQARMEALAGICEKNTGDVEDAERNLSAALPLVANPKIHLLILTNLVELQYSRGELEAASATVAELLKNEPKSPDALYMAYRIHSDLADSARNALSLAAPDSARMHLLTAERFINAGDATSAIREFQQALAKDSSLPGVHYELGQAILQESTVEASLDRAAAEFELALKEPANKAGAEAKLGIIEGLRGHPNLAQSHYARALASDPDEFNALVGMGGILQKSGQEEKAISYFSHAARLNPMDDALHFRLSQIYRNLGRKEDAEREMKAFIDTRDLKSKSNLVDARRKME